MRAILINPWDRSVSEVPSETWSLREMYRALSGTKGFRPCNDINSVRLNRSNFLWVDGEGLLIPEVPVFHFNGYPEPLAGMGLILGVDEAGETIATSFTVEQIEPNIRWTTLVTTGELGRHTSGPGYVRFGDPILKETK